MTRMKVREYARHRGVSHVAVLNAIKSGRLGKSVTRDDKDRPLIDSELADAEWLPTTKEVFKDEASGKPGDRDRARPPVSTRPLAAVPAGGPPMTFAEARELRENYLAKLAQLDFEERSAKLVDAEEVKKQWVVVASIIRTKVLGIPSKSRQRMPDMTPEQYATLESIVRETLEDLADGGD